MKVHTEKGTCPVSLRYNVRANITPDEEFKTDIKSLRKEAERKLVGALTRFHYRWIESFQRKKLKEKQNTRPNKNNSGNHAVKSTRTKAQSPTRQTNVLDYVRELTDKFQNKFAQMSDIMQQLSDVKNKESESHTCLLTECTDKSYKREDARKL